METLKSSLKVIGYICLVLFTVYAGFFSDNKNLAWYPIIAWGLICYYWWLEERERAKIREDERFQRLSARVSYLEREMEKLDR